MVTLAEQTTKLVRHRAAMASVYPGTNPPVTGWNAYDYRDSRMIVTFTQDRDRSVEWWSDDAYAAELERQHAATKA